MSASWQIDYETPSAGLAVLAMHDGPLAERLIEFVRGAGLARNDFEFQVLLGVQEVPVEAPAESRP